MLYKNGDDEQDALAHLSLIRVVCFKGRVVKPKVAGYFWGLGRASEKLVPASCETTKTTHGHYRGFGPYMRN